jgi:hypothetical protein
MVKVEHGEYNGMQVDWVSNDLIKMAITTQRGPRAIFLGWQDGGNLFAELPDLSIPSVNGPYYLLGGHRLWHSPEWSTRTYWPETQAIQVVRQADGVTVTLPADGASIEKSMQFVMFDDQPVVTVTHSLRNNGLWTVELAPWAITQCRLGGIVLLPQPVEPADPEGLLPNKHYSFWPYTNFSDGRIVLGREMTLLHARPAPPTKLGYCNQSGWAGYWLDGTLFSKSFDPQLHANHPDFGCNTECYCNDRFVEVETLGPLTQLKPEATVLHVETWQLRSDIPRPDSEAMAMEVARGL